MQIFPTNSSASPSAFFSGMDYSGNTDSSFLDAMNTALDSVREGDSHSATSALADEASQPLVESPYTRHTTDGLTYSLDEVTFTKSELEELRQQLLKEGAPEESLQQFDVLAGQPDGATLAQVIASLMGRRPNNFNDEDAHAITSLLGRIDPTGSLAEDAIAMMREGNGAGAWDLIQGALGKLGADDAIDVSMAELLALGRGLGLNADAMRGIASNMGGNDNLALTAGQFDALMNPAKNFFMQQAANADKLDSALEKTLKPLIARARERMEKEKDAASLQSRRVEQSKILIDKTVQERSRQMLDDTATGQASHDDVKAFNEAMARKLNNKEIAGAPNPENIRTAQAEMADKANNSQKAKNSQAAVNTDNAGQDAKAQLFARENRGQQSGQDARQQGEGKSDTWKELLGKIETKPVAHAPAPNASSFVYSMLQGNAGQEVFAGQTQLAGHEPQLPQQVASQVQQGLLTAMRDGATRLDLQLHPAELGMVAVTLIARNGEVTARLSSDKSETVEMMNRQLETMRVNLEQQGVKVDKIEVQLQNQRDNADGSFQDLNQHNARQEENARQQQLTRIRNLASLRNDRINEQNSTLARSMHDMAQTARYAGQSVHIVA